MNKLLFVYGTLMKEMANHQFLCNAKFICESETDAKYLMSANFIPFVTPEKYVHDELNRKKLCRIKGELYEVEDYTLKIIDQLEGHPTFYKRELKLVNTPDRGFIDAWIYLNPYTEGTIIPDGDYKSYLKMRKNYSQYVQANK